MWRKVKRICSPMWLPLSHSAEPNAKASALARNCKQRTNMKLVEQHVIKRGEPRYQRIDEADFASKNLGNAANCLVRQSFISQGVYLNNAAVFHLVKDQDAYQALPREVSNQALI